MSGFLFTLPFACIRVVAWCVGLYRLAIDDEHCRGDIARRLRTAFGEDFRPSLGMLAACAGADAAAMLEKTVFMKAPKRWVHWIVDKHVEMAGPRLNALPAGAIVLSDHNAYYGYGLASMHLARCAIISPGKLPPSHKQRIEDMMGGELQEIVPGPAAAMETVRTLRNNGLVFTFADHYEDESNIALVEVMERLAVATTTPAFLAFRTGAPIFIAHLYLDGGRFSGTVVRVELKPASEFRDKNSGILSYTQAIQYAISGAIRQRPRDYCYWQMLGRRWDCANLFIEQAQEET